MFTGNLFSVCIAPEYSHWESNAVVVCGGGMNKKTGAIYRGKIMWHWRLLLEFHCPKMRLVRWGVIAFHDGIIWSLPTCTLPSASLALCLTHASFLASPQRPNTKTSHFWFALPSFHYDRGMQACTHMCKITNKVMYAYVHHMWSFFKMIKKNSCKTMWNDPKIL